MVVVFGLIKEIEAISSDSFDLQKRVRGCNLGAATEYGPPTQKTNFQFGGYAQAQSLREPLEP
jgi:hypothetical protein